MTGTSELWSQSGSLVLLPRPMVLDLADLMVLWSFVYDM